MPVLPNSALPGNSLSGGFFQQIGQAASSSLLGSVGLSSRSNAVNVADMFKYSSKTTAPAPRFTYPNASQDWRIRISLPPGANYFYNDPQLHWLVLMANDIIDPRFEWPLSYYNLIEYCKGKYGQDQIYHTHHYVNEVEFIVDGSRVIEEESTYENPIPIIFETSNAYESTLLFQNYNIKSTPVTNFDYEDSLNESKRRILVIKPSVVSELDSTFTQLIKA